MATVTVHCPRCNSDEVGGGLGNGNYCTLGAFFNQY
ncbi:TPA: IS1 family transposase [Escherichia coli]